MIHDALTQHFRSTPEPQLPARFTAQLYARLEADRCPSRRTAAFVLIRRWAPRVYWIAAGVLAAKTTPRADFAPPHVLALAAAGFLIALALQRALRPVALTRILRDALLR